MINKVKYILIILFIIVIFYMYNYRYNSGYSKGYDSGVNDIKIKLNEEHNKKTDELINKNIELSNKLREEQLKKNKIITKIKQDIVYVYKENDCSIDEQSIKSINEQLEK